VALVLPRTRGRQQIEDGEPVTGLMRATRSLRA